MDQKSDKATATNKLLSKSQLCDETAHNKSWFDEVEESEEIVNIMEEKSKSSDSNGSNVSKPKGEYVLAKKDDENPSDEREIVVEFLDNSNEEKYERLVKEEKLKTPLKRRLSSNQSSRSNSPLDEVTGASNFNVDENSRTFYSKKTKVDSEGNYFGHDQKKRPHREYEESEEILARRQKQIDYGKNTIGYDNYTKMVPLDQRMPDHPWTPPKHHKYSRRAFDGLIKVWRKKLHCYDPSSGGVEGAAHDQDEH